MTFFFSELSPLIIFGYAFLQNCGNYFNLFSFLKKRLNSLLALKLNKFANDESLLFVNVKPYCRQFATAVSALCLNLREHLALCKDVLNSAEEIF